MVMDLLDGEDLGALVRRVGALPIDEVIAWTLQACDAVGEAHAAGFIHRDLKLANLFLAQSQHGPMLKVLDFGLAKAMVRESDDQSLTGADTFLGTPHYMAPEMFMCARDVDARADVWALGICLYRMLTDRHPFETASVIALCANVLHSDPIPPSKHRRDLPPGLEEIVLLCLAREPGARFADARELAASLQALKARSRPRHVPFTLTRLHVAQPFVALPVEPDEAPTELRRLERTAPMPVGGHDPRRR
jgi:serine/threonine-protein kinase